jgi:hypothetical protein
MEAPAMAHRHHLAAAPLDVALVFTKAWSTHDLATAASYVAEDIVFDGPLQQTTGAKAYLEGLAALSEQVTGLLLIAAFGDADKALLMYDLSTSTHGTLSCAKCLTIGSDGKIRRDKLVFDSARMRPPSHGPAAVLAPADTPAAQMLGR